MTWWLQTLDGDAIAYLASGGLAAIPLVVLALLLWFFIGLRICNLHRGWRGTVDALVGEVHRLAGEAGRETASQSQRPNLRGGVLVRVAIRGFWAVHVRPGNGPNHEPNSGSNSAIDGAVLDGIIAEEGENLGKFRGAIFVISSVAPLLGLLGTVNGMIETFDSLTKMALFAQSGGVAGGISEALVSTQMGLFVAIPGLMAGRILQGKEDRLRNDLARLKRLLRVRFCCDLSREQAGGDGL